MPAVSISQYFDILSQSQKIYSRQLEPVCKKWELTRSELDVLLFLYNNPEYDRAADIVAHRGMAKSHVSMSVASLEQRGLLERSDSEKDRRTVHLVLTPEGKEIAVEGKAAQQEFFASLYSDVDPEEFRMWERVTQKIQANITHLSK
jgi:MarR family transcriptional regulator for hemolysin